jgi:hypothetical protein
MSSKVAVCVPGNSQLLQDPFVKLPHCVLVNAVFGQMTLRQLARFRQISTFFCQTINQDPNLRQLLNYSTNIQSWAPTQTFYVNKAFLTPGDIASRVGCACQNANKQFSLQTLLNIATCLRSLGPVERSDQWQPLPCTLGLHQPRYIPFVAYVEGILGVNDEKDPLQPGPTRIFFHLYRIKDSPPKSDRQYGQKAFLHWDGYCSTAVEKARAIERYVFERYLDRPLWFCKEKVNANL